MPRRYDFYIRIELFGLRTCHTKQNDTRLSLKSNQKDPDLDLTIGDNQKLNLPYGKYFLIANAPKYERKKIKLKKMNPYQNIKILLRHLNFKISITKYKKFKTICNNS